MIRFLLRWILALTATNPFDSNIQKTLCSSGNIPLQISLSVPYLKSHIPFLYATLSERCITIKFNQTIGDIEISVLDENEIAILNHISSGNKGTIEHIKIPAIPGRYLIYFRSIKLEAIGQFSVQ